MFGVNGWVVDVSTHKPLVAKHWRFLTFVESSCLQGLFHFIKAVNSPHIHCFSNVEPLGEPAVVSTEEGQNVVLGVLISLVDLDSMFHQLKGVNHESNAVEELPLSGLVQDIGIEFIFVGFGNHVPGLDASLVTIVDGVEPEILHVPAECREQHTHINPGDGDSTDFLLVLFADLENGALRLVDIVEVEGRSCIIEVFVLGLQTFVHGES
jgi:hypothetical protein